jgi:hypothetical protein
MVNFDVRIDKKNIVPSLFFIVKLSIFAILTHLIIFPLILQTFTFFGELRGFWQSVLIVVIAAYLARVIKFKFKGREWF